MARQVDDKQGLRFNLIGLGSLAVRQGDYRSAESRLEEAVAVSGELREDYTKAAALQHLGELALGRGAYGRARDLLDEALALMQEVGSPTGVLNALAVLARVAHAEGDRGAARQLLEEALARVSPGIFLEPLEWLGELAADEGDTGEARRLLEQARDLAQTAADQGIMAQALYSLGELARAEGDLRQAVALHHEALQRRRQIGDAPGIAASLEAVAGLGAKAGRCQHAARLFGAAQALRDRNDYARATRESPRYETDLALVHQELSAEELENAFAQGAGLTMEEAVIQGSKGRRRRGRPASGWASLTDTEEQVAAPAAEGLTNAEIAERRFISLETVPRRQPRGQETANQSREAASEVKRLRRRAPCRRRTRVPGRWYRTPGRRGPPERD